MTIKKTSTLFLFILLGFCYSFSQSGLKQLQNTEFIEQPHQDPFLISTRPITNREYLIYLLWTQMVNDDSSRFIQAFPCLHPSGVANVTKGIEEYNKTHQYRNDPCLFRLCYNNADSLVRCYFLSPQYLDYPILGLSQLQANRFCKWLSDRYNEVTLIRRGYFYFNPNQYGDDIFVSEAYLMNQYEGLQKRKAWGKPIISWEKHILIPAFRLPTVVELELAGKTSHFETEMKAYPFSTSNILYQWYRFYEIKTKDYIQFYYGCDGLEPFGESNKNFSASAIHPSELTFDSELNSGSPDIKVVFDQLDLLIGDSVDVLMHKNKNIFGQMDFIIVDETSEGKPYIVKNYDNSTFSNNKENKYITFRFACTMKPKQYMP